MKIVQLRPAHPGPRSHRCRRIAAVTIGSSAGQLVRRHAIEEKVARLLMLPFRQKGAV